MFQITGKFLKEEEQGTCFMEKAYIMVNLTYNHYLVIGLRNI